MRSTRQHPRRMAAVLSVLAVALTGLVVTGAAPSVADETKCEPNHTWYKIFNRKNFLKVDPADVSDVEHNGTSQPMKITDNYKFAISSTASNSTTTGKEVSAGVTVGWFNAGAGYQTSDTQGMDTSSAQEMSITRNITLEPGQRAVAYAGHQYTRAFVYKKTCSQDGKRVRTVWSGWVEGPRYRQKGWKLCSNSNLC